MQIIFALGLDLLFAGPILQPIALAGIGLVLAPTARMMAGKAAEHGSASHSEPRPFRDNAFVPVNALGEKKGTVLPDPHGVGRTT